MVIKVTYNYKTSKALKESIYIVCIKKENLRQQKHTDEKFTYSCYLLILSKEQAFLPSENVTFWNSKILQSEIHRQIEIDKLKYIDNTSENT